MINRSLDEIADVNLSIVFKFVFSSKWFPNFNKFSNTISEFDRFLQEHNFFLISNVFLCVIRTTFILSILISLYSKNVSININL